MKILVHGLNYAPEPTGTGRYTAEMAEWLAARGHQVVAMVGLPHYPQWRVPDDYRGWGAVRHRRETIRGVEVLRVPHLVPAPERVSAGGRLLLELSFGLAAMVRGAALRPDFDVGIVATPPLESALIMSVLCGRRPLGRSIPWVLHVQDLQVDAALELDILPAIARRPLLRGEVALLRRATAVSTITEAMRDRLVQKGLRREDVWLFPNWADESMFVPGRAPESLRRELGVDPGRILAVYAGNIGRKQGLEVVIDAAGRLPNVVFAIVGSGADEPRIKALAAERNLENLVFRGPLSNERFRDLLDAGDVHLVVQKGGTADLVMPSKLANILAAGRPCVVTAAPGTTLHRVATGCPFAEACPPGRADALADAIGRVHERGSTTDAEVLDQIRATYSKERILTEFETRLRDMARDMAGTHG